MPAARRRHFAACAAAAAAGAARQGAARSAGSRHSPALHCRARDAAGHADRRSPALAERFPLRRGSGCGLGLVGQKGSSRYGCRCHVLGQRVLDQRRIVIDNLLEWQRERQVDPGDRPHEDQREGPETDRTMQIPVEPLPVGFEIDFQTALDAACARPPDHEPAEADDDQKDREYAVHLPAFFSSQQIDVEIHEPRDDVD